MKRLFLVLSAFLATALSGFAQINRSGEVVLLEFDGKTALIAVDACAPKKGDLLQSAKQTLFDRLLYSGIDGLNGDRRLLNKSRDQLKTKDYVVNFYTKKMAAYIKRDDSGKNDIAEQICEIASTPDGYTVTYIIPIKYNVLIRDLKTEGLLNQ